MTGLLHHHLPTAQVSDEEAVSYIHGTGPWSRFLVTPWPMQSLVEGAAVLVFGLWAAVAISVHSLSGGLATLAFTVLAALVVAAPGAYTESHREYAARYRAAVRVHGDAGDRAHPFALLLAAPVVWALVGAFGGVAGLDRSAGARVGGAMVGAVVGFVFACVRIRRTRRSGG